MNWRFCGSLLTAALITLAGTFRLGSATTPPDPGWASLEKGLEFREVHLGPSSAESIFEVRCQPDRTRLALLSAAHYGKRDMFVSEMVSKSHCWAAVNGGYFDESHQPMGYQRDADHVLCPTIRTAGLFGGVFVVGPQGPELLARQDFTPGPYTFALQCGPRLISQGKPIPGIHADPPTRRTGIGVDHQGRIFLYATGPAARFTFAQTQAWLAGPSSQGGLDPVGVLNLDGGSSTQMNVSTSHITHNVASWAAVPFAVGIFPR